MTRKYHQRAYFPKHPEKYKGDPNQIFMRSSWETRFAIWADNNPSVIAWGSETVVIGYISPLDNRTHRYFVDFWIRVKTKTGAVETYLVEIKPYAQCVPPGPARGRRTRERVLEEAEVYAVNQAKWQYARDYCKKRGWKFIVITENELGL